MNTHHDQELGPLSEWVEAVRNQEVAPADYDQARRNLFQRLPEQGERPAGGLLRNPLTAGLTVAAVAVLVISPLLGGGGQAYARVVASLNNAVTIAFSADWYFDGHPEPTRVEMAFRQPGLQRMVMSYQGEETIQINDTKQNRGLVLVPSTKTYVEVDLEQMPDTERERINLVHLVTDELRSIPDTADEVLEVAIIDDREVKGFRAGRRTLWIDEDQAASLQETQENGRSFARASQRAVVFVMGMTPDQGWHYAGHAAGLTHPGGTSRRLDSPVGPGRTTHARAPWTDDRDGGAEGSIAHVGRHPDHGCADGPQTADGRGRGRHRPGDRAGGKEAPGSIGCVAARICNTNNCPAGIATQKKDLRQKLNVENGAKQLANFSAASTELMQVLARACGHHHLNEFCLEDLATWDRRMADLSGIPFSGVEG